MILTLELEPELEQVLEAQAHSRGVTVETLIHDLVSQQARIDAPVLEAQKSFELPVRNLGDMGSLHRRDIYDDVR